VDNRPSGGFYLGGQYRLTFDNKQLWVQALNDTGEVDWETRWGSAYDEPNAHLTTAADGHVLVASAWGLGDNWYLRRYLTKLDSADGSIIWDRMYGPAMYYGTFYVVQEVNPGGDLIAVGDSYEGSTDSGVLLRTTSEGDSLWMRYFSYNDSLVTNGDAFLRDVQPTPDGGFIAVGTAYGAGGIYGQDVWVVKTDSMGCLEPGCHLIMGMQTQITNLRAALKVSPNPVASASTVLVHLDLPANFSPQGALRLSVVSSDGRVVREEQFTSSTTPFTFPAPSSAGLYHIHLSDATRWISGAKLVVE